MQEAIRIIAKPKINFNSEKSKWQGPAQNHPPLIKGIRKPKGTLASSIFLYKNA